MKEFKYDIYDIRDCSYEDDDMLHIHADCYLFLGDINSYEGFKLLGDNGFKPTKIVLFFKDNVRYGELIEWSK